MDQCSVLLAGINSHCWLMIKENLTLQLYSLIAPFLSRPFDIFGLGVDEAKSCFDDYEDRVRFFAEECDYLEGVQMLVDSDDGFGGFGSEMVRYLRDDFGSKCINVFPTFPADVTGILFISLFVWGATKKVLILKLGIRVVLIGRRT